MKPDCAATCKILALLSALLCLAASCSSGAAVVGSPFDVGVQVGRNGRFVVPAELADEYALFMTGTEEVYGMFPGSLDFRKAYVYYQFNELGGAYLRDQLVVKFLAAQVNERDALADELARRLGGSSDGGSDLFDYPPDPSFEMYVIRFGGDVSIDRLFQMAIYTVQTFPEAVHSVILNTSTPL